MEQIVSAGVIAALGATVFAVAASLWMGRRPRELPATAPGERQRTPLP